LRQSLGSAAAHGKAGLGGEGLILGRRACDLSQESGGRQRAVGAYTLVIPDLIRDRGEPLRQWLALKRLNARSRLQICPRSRIKSGMTRLCVEHAQSPKTKNPA
jgi:hypothetical protein